MTQKQIKSQLPQWLQSYSPSQITWNGVTAYIAILPIERLAMNGGQIEGLPSNPREWTQSDFEELCSSIEETPDLMVARGCIVTPDYNSDELVVLGGNMRFCALKHLGYESVPCVLIPADTELEKKRQIAIKDNTHKGRYDFNKLTTDWADMPLAEWGVAVWDMADELQKGGSEPISVPSEKGAVSSNRLLMKFNGNNIQMSETELKGLQDAFDSYVEEVGSSFGFVTYLLEGGAN